MLWRFGERPASGGDPPLLYDELRHRLRSGEGPWVRLPHNPALILSLLLRVHAQEQAEDQRGVVREAHPGTLTAAEAVSQLVVEQRRVAAGGRSLAEAPQHAPKG